MKRPALLRARCLVIVGAACAVTTLVAVGCSPATVAPVDSEELTEDTDIVGEALTGPVPVGSELRTTGNLNLRKGPGTGYGVLHVVPKNALVTVVESNPQNGFYKISHDGTVGFSHGSYLEPVGSVVGALPVGTVLSATTSVNLRSGPSTSYQVLTVVPGGGKATLVASDPKNGFYNLSYGGHTGWSSSKYYTVSSGGSGGSGGGSAGSGGSGGGSAGSGGGATSVVAAAMQRAELAPGHSYWWGHGRFREGGPGNQGGSCSGSCPNCSHSGSYGADCSGFVAKVWQVPSSNTNMSVDSHPYSTADFNNSTSQWTIINRSTIKKADAMNYRSGGKGHVFIYSSGDPWGSIYAYECKGCSAGCVKGYRTATSAYKAVRRKGY